MKDERIIQLAAEAGAKAALEIWDKQWQERRRQLHNTRLWNTRMLLKHYKSLKKYCDNAVYDKDTALASESPVDILESLGCCKKDMYLESVKSSVIRTRTIMAHVDTMLNVYRIVCDASGKVDEQRRYRVLSDYYFTGQTRDSICQIENIDKSTYYRDMKYSTEMLCALIFGADGLAAMRQS